MCGRVAQDAFDSVIPVREVANLVVMYWLGLSARDRIRKRQQPASSIHSAAAE
jgi:hypothetical protein